MSGIVLKLAAPSTPATSTFSRILLVMETSSPGPGEGPARVAEVQQRVDGRHAAAGLDVEVLTPDPQQEIGMGSPDRDQELQVEQSGVRRVVHQRRPDRQGGPTGREFGSATSSRSRQDSSTPTPHGGERHVESQGQLMGG